MLPFDEAYTQVPTGGTLDAVLEGVDLASAMAALPARYRQLLLLKYDNGYSEREIAQMCDMTQDSVKKTIQRAKKKLELLLNEQEV